VWAELLREYVPETKYQLPKDRDARVLSVGCGSCPEALSLNQYFGKSKRVGRDSLDGVDFIGVDIDGKAIERARFDYQMPDWNSRPIEWVPEPGYTFIPGDATRIQDLVQGRFDVVVYAHPEILHRENIWAGIFNQVANLQQSGDLLIATLRLPEEKETALKSLQPPYHIRVATENKHMQTGYSPQDERHKFVVMGIRK